MEASGNLPEENYKNHLTLASAMTEN